MRVREMPWFERPGTRLRRKGPDALSDAELLAIVLGRGSREENAVDLSRRVLGTANLQKLAAMTLPEVTTAFGDTVKALRVCAMFELFRRTNRLRSGGFSQSIGSAEDVYHYFAETLADKTKEHFYALSLDTKNHVVAETLVSLGILDASLIHPREVFNPAIRASAKSVILVHNHPSGEATPSAQDKTVTAMLRQAGDVVGIEVLDHVIVGKDCYTSLREKGDW
jgi:DNA repair protein RadC